MRLVLASSAKNRKDIFDMIGWKYEIIKSTVEEKSDSIDPKQYVIDLSKDKANSVADQLEGKAIVVAADSIMYMDNKIFEKPVNKKEAFENMKLMSGNVVYAITGITVKDLYKNKEVSLVDTAEVYFRKIEDEEINWYVENDANILNCCGFSLEGKASIFIDKVIGDYNTIRGISVNKLCQIFSQLGYSISDFGL